MATAGKTARGDGTMGADSAGDLSKESSGEMWGDLFLARLAPETQSGLSPAQLDDIRRVAAAMAPGRHGLDWRFSVPSSLGGKRFYGVLLAGTDRRSPHRHAQDRMIRRQQRRGRSARTSIQALAVGFALTLIAVVVLETAVPALPFLGLAMIVAEPAARRPLARDRARGYVTALGLVLVVAALLFGQR